MSLYRGSKGDLDWSLEKDGRPFDPGPSQKIRNHSPDGFAWGYGGSGPAQFALGLLLDVTGDREIAESHYMQFKSDVVSRLPDDFQLTTDEVKAWLMEHANVSVAEGA